MQNCKGYTKKHCSLVVYQKGEGKGGGGGTTLLEKIATYRSAPKWIHAMMDRGSSGDICAGNWGSLSCTCQGVQQKDLVKEMKKCKNSRLY